MRSVPRTRPHGSVAITLGAPIVTKKFWLSADDIEDLATGHGGCIATDLITVHGKRVGYMYREAPEYEDDSGWRFMSGHESQEYMDNPENHEVYDVNTIANYDRDIIPLLNAPVGSAYERGTGGVFVELEISPDSDSVH